MTTPPADRADADSTNQASHPAPRLLYLDMNVWIDLARGLKHGDSGWEQIHARVNDAVQDGTLIVPLSPAHYLELWHRGDSDSRNDIARLMRDLSDYATVPSAHVVRQEEARIVVANWAGEGPRLLIGRELLGRGAAHAFGRRTGRFRFVSSVASPDGLQAEGPGVAPPDIWTQLQDHPKLEWFQLVGHPELLAMEEGLDRTPEHRFGTTQLRQEQALRDKLREHPLTGERLHDLIVAQEFASMTEYIEEVCVREQVPVPLSLRSGNWGTESRTAIKDLVASIPTAHVWSTLRHLKHRDLNLPWEQHDWTDLWALSVAIPYCNIVVTEKRWAHLASASGLGRCYGTEVGAGLSALQRSLRTQSL